MIDQEQFRLYAVRPALEFLEPEIPYSLAAENLLMGTAAHESKLTYLHQNNGGPARGFFQMEPATEQSIWTDYLQFHAGLRRKIEQLAGVRGLDMQANIPYQVAMARIKYWWSPLPLPDAGDIIGQAKLWKTVYNTPEGRGTEVQFIKNYPEGI